MDSSKLEMQLEKYECQLSDRRNKRIDDMFNAMMSMSALAGLGEVFTPEMIKGAKIMYMKYLLGRKDKKKYRKQVLVLLKKIARKRNVMSY